MAGLTQSYFCGASSEPIIYETIGNYFESIVEKYPDTGPLLPAMGYGEEQIKDLEETIANTPADLVLIGTPIDLRRVVEIKHPSQRVLYELQEIGRPTLGEILKKKFGAS